MSPRRFARVVVDVPARVIATAFDYRIPDSLISRVTVGSPVMVPFSNRTLPGWVVEVIADTRVSKVSDIIAVLGEPVFDEISAALALWIAEEYVSPLCDAVRLILPPGTTFKVSRSNKDGGVVWHLSPPRVRSVEERWVIRTDLPFQPRASALAQQAVLKMLDTGPLSLRELREMVGASAAQAVMRLEQAGAVRLEDRRRYRRPNIGARSFARPKVLSEGQKSALQAILRSLAGNGGTILIDGVTGSGKTEVYLQAIEQVLRDGGGAIVLVPEISLTPQTVGRFKARFNDDVAVLHSRLSAGERLDEWDRVRTGQARVVVGARSALFAPVKELRLIIVDEEHDSSYKQGSSPRYHVREVARRIAGMRSATLVLGSATPSLESLHHAEEGRFALLRMPRRVAGGIHPAVTVVDMAAEFASGHRSMFSRELIMRLEAVQRHRSKAVLLLNRRGFAAFLLCRECGYVPRCDSCSTSMTYHSTGPTLACHHCAARRAVPSTCPKCGSVYLRRFGAGTQRVEVELSSLVPNLPVVRMDADTTACKGGHERRLVEFEGLESGVLLGTQMVAKGLDYPEVTLVGVLNADTTLHFPDFRSGERTFQLLSQVAGRAGRGCAGGHVVIQTYWPEHPAIRAVATGCPEVFLEGEREARRELGFPPYGRLANIIVSGPEESSVRDAAVLVAQRLSELAPSELRIIGPSPAPLLRLRRTYRWHVLVKSPSDAQLPVFLREVLGPMRFAKVSLAIDVDPADLL